MRRASIVLAVWTLLVWGGRIRNVVADEALDGVGRGARLLLAIGLVALALAVLARRQRGPALVLAGSTIAVWVVRGGGILLDDHAASFKAVHTLLALASIALAAWVVATSRSTGALASRTSWASQ